MTKERNPATAPIASNFIEAAKLPPAERRDFLLGRLERVMELSERRYYLNKNGDEIPNPDGSTMVKAIAAVSLLYEKDPDLERDAEEAKRRIVAALNRIPELASEADAVAQKRAVLSVLKDAAIVAALKPNADVNAAVGTFRVVAQVLGLGKGDEEDMSEEELQQYAKGLLGKQEKNNGKQK